MLLRRHEGTETVGGAHEGGQEAGFSLPRPQGDCLLGTPTLNLLQCPVPGAQPDVLSVSQSKKGEVVRPGFPGPELHTFRAPGCLPGHSDTPTPASPLLSGTPGPSWLVSAGRGKAMRGPGLACAPAGRGAVRYSVLQHSPRPPVVNYKQKIRTGGQGLRQSSGRFSVLKSPPPRPGALGSETLPSKYIWCDC